MELYTDWHRIFNILSSTSVFMLSSGSEKEEGLGVGGLGWVED